MASIAGPNMPLAVEDSASGAAAGLLGRWALMGNRVSACSVAVAEVLITDRVQKPWLRPLSNAAAGSVFIGSSAGGGGAGEAAAEDGAGCAVSGSTRPDCDVGCCTVALFADMLCSELAKVGPQVVGSRWPAMLCCKPSASRFTSGRAWGFDAAPTLVSSEQAPIPPVVGGGTRLLSSLWVPCGCADWDTARGSSWSAFPPPESTREAARLASWLW